MTERERIIERLRDVDLGGGSHESLSALAKAIYEPVGGWTIGACEQLRQTLVRLLGEADTPTSGGRITDELRKFIDDKAWMANNYAKALAIADRIDEKYEEALGSKVAMAISVGEDGTEFVSMPAKELSEHYVKLPKDADGEYIHIGDRMENNERVARIVLTDDSWEPSVYLEKLPNVLHEYFCHEISHYHAPTVEDVLCELLDKVDDDRSGQAEIIAEYAAKLREMLAGDAG